MFFDGRDSDFQLHALVDFPFLELGELRVEAIDFRVDLVEAVMESCFNLVDLAVELSDIFSECGEAAFDGVGEVRRTFASSASSQPYIKSIARSFGRHGAVLGGVRRACVRTRRS